MAMRPEFYITDLLILSLFIIFIVGASYASCYEHLRAPWRRVFKKKIAVVSAIVLSVFIAIGLLDSIHVRLESQLTSGVSITNTKSVLDLLLAPLDDTHETSYSAPFASKAFTLTTETSAAGQATRLYKPLQYVSHYTLPGQKLTWVVVANMLYIALESLLLVLLVSTALLYFRAKRQNTPLVSVINRYLKNQNQFPWQTALLTGFIMLFMILVLFHFSRYCHIFGTDKVGRDIFYTTLKSVRTGLIIGTLTTLIILPFATLMGVAAGYFGGVIDDVIQYLYTTLSSIPGVLLISATILSVQIYMARHDELLQTTQQRAEIRLLVLCFVLGLTSWTSLCRLLRAEVLKLREMDYVQAAKVLGAGHYTILMRHLVPNVMHIILITIVLDFSALVLAEAVLSYVGVGVDAATYSWGNMLNGARLELAREPVVWWPLLSAFSFMFTMVLSANLFSDAVREAFDPRAI